MTDRVAEVVADLPTEALRCQLHPEFSPIGWHLGHVSWQRECWLLRPCGRQAALAPEHDELFDSFRSDKGARGQELPSREQLLDYASLVEDAVATLHRSRAGDPAWEARLRLANNHERQHAEIVLSLRLLGGLYRRSSSAGWPLTPTDRGRDNPWLLIEGGPFRRGCAARGTVSSDPDAWDNEFAEHPVQLAPFFMQRHPVSEEEWLGWMEEGGYGERRFWSDEGWHWRSLHDVEAPGNWQRDGNGTWCERTLAGLRAVGGATPVAHVSWSEAQAFAHSRGARLPREAEWEYAASWRRGEKLRFPWGGQFDEARADLGRSGGRRAPRGTHRAGASPWGVEDLCGGVWEWTQDVFSPYPDFRPGLYLGYSAPWFGPRHRVARGGSWLTAPANARATFRNWYEPHVRQICLGLRLVRDA